MILYKTTYSCDCGSLKVGNDDYQILIENGIGDGDFDVFVVDSDNDVPDYAKMVTCGYMKDMHLFYYDCGVSKSKKKWSGSFFFYNHNGDIYILKYRDNNHWSD